MRTKYTATLVAVGVATLTGISLAGCSSPSNSSEPSSVSSSPTEDGIRQAGKQQKISSVTLLTNFSPYKGGGHSKYWVDGKELPQKTNPSSKDSKPVGIKVSDLSAGAKFTVTASETCNLNLGVRHGCAAKNELNFTVTQMSHPDPNALLVQANGVWRDEKTYRHESEFVLGQQAYDGPGYKKQTPGAAATVSTLQVGGTLKSQAIRVAIAPHGNTLIVALWSADSQPAWNNAANQMFDTMQELAKVRQQIDGFTFDLNSASGHGPEARMYEEELRERLNKAETQRQHLSAKIARQSKNLAPQLISAS